MEYIAFFGCIKHLEIDNVEEILKEYEIGAYLIGLEISLDSHEETDGEHMHFVVQMTDQDYHRFSKRVFIDKYKLRGKALKDKPRQYGRVKRIQDLERMCAYTLKDYNIRSNMTEKQLDSYKNISFKKQEIKEHKELLFDYVTNNWTKTDFARFDNWNQGLVVNEFENAFKLMIRYYRAENKPRRKNILEPLVLEYLGKTGKWNEDDEYKFFYK